MTACASSGRAVCLSVCLPVWPNSAQLGSSPSRWVLAGSSRAAAAPHACKDTQVMFIYFAFLFTTHSSSRQHAHHLAVVQGIRDDASYRGGLPHPSYSPAGPMGHGSISFPYLPASTSLALLPLCPGELPPLPAPQPSHTRTHPHPWEVIAPTLDAPGQSPKTTLPGAGVASLCARPISTCPHFPLPDKARSPSAAARARSCQVVHLPFVPKSPENDHIVIDPPPPHNAHVPISQARDYAAAAPSSEDQPVPFVIVRGLLSSRWQPWY